MRTVIIVVAVAVLACGCTVTGNLNIFGGRTVIQQGDGAKTASVSAAGGVSVPAEAIGGAVGAAVKGQ